MTTSPSNFDYAKFTLDEYPADNSLFTFNESGYSLQPYFYLPQLLPHSSQLNKEKAWLGYLPLPAGAAVKYSALPRKVVRLGNSPPLLSAETELIGGLRSLLNDKFGPANSAKGPALFLGTADSLEDIMPGFVRPRMISGDGFWIGEITVRGKRGFLISSRTDRGVLYGVFAFLRKIAQGEPLNSVVGAPVSRQLHPDG